MVDFTGMDAVQAIVLYFARHGSELPNHIYDKFVDAIASPDGMGTMNTALEGLYSVCDEVGQEGRELLRDLSRFFAEKNFLGKGARGAEINTVIIRILGGGEVEVEGDPEVDPDYAPPPPLPEQPEE
jgi:hypothetical protein